MAVRPKLNKINADIGNVSIYVRSVRKWGKELPVSEKVLRSDGWVPMGNISKGDMVYGDDGKLHEVLGVYPQGIKDVYEVTFSDGKKCRCGLEHLWSLRNAQSRDNKNPYRIYHLSDIIDDITYKAPNSHVMYKYSIPQIKPIEFEKQELRLDPYLLGLILGDGGVTGNVITFTNMEEETLTEFENLISGYGCTCNRRYPNGENSSVQLTVKKPGGAYRNPIIDILKDIDIHGKDSRQKFVPKDYLYSSVEDRASILSGLINTDGYVPINRGKGTRLEFRSYSEQLANDVRELAWSLGYKSTLSVHDRTNEESTDKYEEEIEYCVSIMGNDFTLLRLSNKHKSRLTDNYIQVKNSIVSVEKVGREESQCIYVDNPSHLFIAGDYVPTHNTSLFRDTVIEKYKDPEKGLLICCGHETGATMLDDINVAEVATWAELKELVDWLIDEKGKEHDIQIVAFDTADELVLMADDETIRLSNRENPQKRVKSIKAAFGGYTAGEKYSANYVIKPMITRLRKAGFGVWAIAHTAYKTVKEKGSLDEDGYMQLTSNLPKDYESAFGDIFDITVTGVIDRDGETVESEVNGKTKKKKYVTSETRKLYFRGTTSIEAGGRLTDYSETPDLMVFEPCQNNAAKFIKIIEDGMEHSKIKYRNYGAKSVPKSTATDGVEETHDEAPKVEESEVDDVFVDEDVKDVVDSKYPDNLLEETMALYKSAPKDKKSIARKIIKENGNNFQDVSEDTLREIYDLLAGN